MKNKTKKIINSILDLSNFDNSSWQEELDYNGYVVIRNSYYMKKNLNTLRRKSIELIKNEGDKGGWEGKEKYFKYGKKFESGAQRLGGLVKKDKSFLGLITIPEILMSAYHVIKDDIKICGLNLRNPIEGLGEQSIHFDGFPRKKLSDSFAGVVAFIYLDSANIENGAMRLIPKTHKFLGWPDDHIDINKKQSNEVRVEVDAGTIVIANLNLWHAGAKNINGKSRKVIMMNIKNRKYDQLLNYKKYLGEKFIKNLSDDQKYLLSVRKEDKDQVIESGGSANQLRREYFNSKSKKFSSVANNQ
tara:strand:+ start:529 stop:1434 length:906 start_codon:yes stop_codon:yes gene_type:complete